MCVIRKGGLARRDGEEAVAQSLCADSHANPLAPPPERRTLGRIDRVDRNLGELDDVLVLCHNDSLLAYE